MWRGIGADPVSPATPLVSACPKGQVLDPDTGECAIVLAQPGDVITPCPSGQHTDPAICGLLSRRSSRWVISSTVLPISSSGW